MRGRVPIWLRLREFASSAAFCRCGSIRETTRELRTLVITIFDRTFAITYALYVISITIAVLGVVSTLFALVLERRREIGLLRYLGLRTRDVRRMVYFEAAFIGLLGGVSGVVVGVLLALLLIFVINRQAFGWLIELHMPYDFLGGGCRARGDCGAGGGDLSGAGGGSDSDDVRRCGRNDGELWRMGGAAAFVARGTLGAHVLCALSLPSGLLSPSWLRKPSEHPARRTPPRHPSGMMVLQACDLPLPQCELAVAFSVSAGSCGARSVCFGVVVFYRARSGEGWAAVWV